jgi:hypothetical protein
MESSIESDKRKKIISCHSQHPFDDDSILFTKYEIYRLFGARNADVGITGKASDWDEL